MGQVVLHKKKHDLVKFSYACLFITFLSCKGSSYVCFLQVYGNCSLVLLPLEMQLDLVLPQIRAWIKRPNGRTVGPLDLVFSAQLAIESFLVNSIIVRRNTADNVWVLCCPPSLITNFMSSRFLEPFGLTDRGCCFIRLSLGWRVFNVFNIRICIWTLVYCIYGRVRLIVFRLNAISLSWARLIVSIITPRIRNKEISWYLYIYIRCGVFL